MVDWLATIWTTSPSRWMRALHGDRAGGEDDALLTFVERRPDHQVGDTGFVFDRNEHDTLCGSAFEVQWNVYPAEIQNPLGGAPAAPDRHPQVVHRVLARRQDPCGRPKLHWGLGSVLGQREVKPEKLPICSKNNILCVRRRICDTRFSVQQLAAARTLADNKIAIARAMSEGGNLRPASRGRRGLPPRRRCRISTSAILPEAAKLMHGDEATFETDVVLPA